MALNKSLHLAKTTDFFLVSTQNSNSSLVSFKFSPGAKKVSWFSKEHSTQFLYSVFIFITESLNSLVFCIFWIKVAPWWICSPSDSLTLTYKCMFFLLRINDYSFRILLSIICKLLNYLKNRHVCFKLAIKRIIKTNKLFLLNDFSYHPM